MGKATLVIMAAGIGSRFGGGIKQLEPVGPNGEIIMDYSIYDAMEAGFDKVVFVIRKDLEKDFKEEQTLIVVNNALKIDFDKQLVYKNDQEIHLTKNEYRLLKCLFEQIGKVVTYQTLMTQVWGPYSEDSQILRVNMSNIRKKIETNTLKPEYIITEIGVGYRLRDYRS